MGAPRLDGNSPAMGRINARCAELWSEVRRAEAALLSTNNKLHHRARELVEIEQRLLKARMFEIPVAAESARARKIREIKEAACRLFQVSEADLIGEGQRSAQCLARWYAAQRMTDELGLSAAHCGRALSRDHSTIHHARSPAKRAQVAEWLETVRVPT